MAKRIRGVGVPSNIPRKSSGGVNESEFSPASSTRKAGQQTPGTGGITVEGNTQSLLPASYTRKLFRRVDIDLNDARDTPQEIEVAGTVLWVANASDNDAIVDIRIDKRQNDPIPFLPGTVISGAPFQAIYITNEAQADKTITIMVAQDSPADRIGVET